MLNTTSLEARANESQKLLNWGYQAFDAVRLFEEAQADGHGAGVEGQGKGGARWAPAAPCSSPCPRAKAGKLTTQIERTDPLFAPLTTGQRVGTLKVSTAAGKPVAELPLVVQADVAQAGVFGRAWDTLRLWIK